MKGPQKIIAVDFDGTIVEHRFPAIGDEMIFAFESLKFLQERGHLLILWTYREGIHLREAVEYCRENGIEFYAINRNYPEEEFVEGEVSRKIKADIYIDDRNAGGFPGWGNVIQMIHPEMGQYNHQLVCKEAHRNYKRTRRRSIWDFFKTAG